MPPTTAEVADLVDAPAAGAVALRGGVLRTAGYAGGVLLAVLSAPLLIRHRGTVEFGRYSTALAVVLVVAGLTEGGLNTVAVRELSTAPDRAARDRAMGELLGLRLILSGAGVALAVAFTALAGYGSSLVLGTLLAGAGMIGVLAQSLLAAELQSRLRFGWATALDFGRQLLLTTLVVALVVAHAGVVAFLSLTIPAGIVGLAAVVVLVRGSIGLRPALRPHRWMPLLQDTLVYAVAIAVNSLCFRVTLIIMSLVATAHETGVFAISFRIMEVLIGVPAILLGAAFPIVARSVLADRARFDASVARMFGLALLAGTATALSVVLAAPFAIAALTGSADHPATAVLRIQGAGVVATFVAAAAAFPLLGLRRTRALLLANLGALITVTTLTLTLAPRLGAQGAALAAVATEALLATASTVALTRASGPALPLREVPLTLALGAAALALGWAAGVHPLVQATAGLLSFAALLKLTRRFPPELAELLRRRTVAAA
jgi:O-antigen/teichoic acid export membrane protein